MPRTGSMASKVGPAVITTRRPASGLGWKNAMISASSSNGSSMRPSPTSPHAWSPLPGPSRVTPSLRSWAALRWVAGADHICRFMAGATSNGQLRAMHRVVSRSSHRPCVSLARKSVEAGATTMASASRERSIWAMLLPTRASHWEVKTVRPESACMVTGVMNWVAPSVMTTCTVAPALVSRRTSSADL